MRLFAIALFYVLAVCFTGILASQQTTAFTSVVEFTLRSLGRF